ncbi:MAG: isopropylmalate isomerase [Myxococcales bacterium]|jgi:hypothetical protein|nr:isopropylmalate isomerase [Myxococcales bacterium]
MSVSLVAFTAPGGATGWVGSWSPGIGDPNIVGWVTVVAYFTASFLCWRRFRELREPAGARAPGRTASLGWVLLAFLPFPFLGARRRLLAMPVRERLRSLWLTLAVVLFLLGINKQLDLQTALTELGRIVARTFGWYADRRPVQLGFIVFVALVGLTTFRTMLFLARGALRNLRAVLAGTLFVICFVTIRAASFHHVDRLLGRDIGGFRMNWVLELGGILFIIVGASLAGGPAPDGGA